MNEKLIDLTKWKKGVTLDVIFDLLGLSDPFLIFITNQDKNMLLYDRVVDTAKVQINLPDHGDMVYLYSERPVKQILTGPIRIDKLTYKFNTGIITKRAYPFSAIQTEIVPFIPDENGNLTDQPARFLPDTGLKQVSAYAMQDKPQPVVKFILEHEDGHYYYGRPLPAPKYWSNFSQTDQDMIRKMYQEDEEEADKYAVYNLINQGYNASNMLTSLTNYLSDNDSSSQRMIRVFNDIQAQHKNFRL